MHHSASHCNTLQHTATHCNTLQHTATHSTSMHHSAPHRSTPKQSPTHRNTPQHTATHGNALQEAGAASTSSINYSTLYLTASLCTSPQHTTLHRNRRAQPPHTSSPRKDVHPDTRCSTSESSRCARQSTSSSSVL